VIEVQLEQLQREQVLPWPLAEVFTFFSAAENLERITPPWLSFQLLDRGAIEMRPGTLIDYRLRLRRVPLLWTSLIETWEENHRFVDQQLRGPYRFWRHEHVFTETASGTRVQDRVDYLLPFGRLGRLAGLATVRRDLERIFDYRHAAVARLLG
jgi:ligand-binding SRPBCC domain-containing protein